MGIGGNLLSRMIAPSGGLYVSDIENKLIQNGLVFGIAKRFTVPASGTVYWGIDPTGFTKNSLLMIPPLFTGFAGGPIHIDVYKGSEYTGGTVIDSINFNENSSEVASIEMSLNPSVSDDGDLQPNDYVVFSNSSGGGANTTQTGGAASAGNLIFDFDVSRKTLYKLTNQSADVADFHLVVDWGEI